MMKQPSNEEEDGQKIGLKIQKKKKSKRKSPRTKEQIDEDKNKPNIERKNYSSLEV